MCRPASFVLTRENLYWDASDSHEEIIKKSGLWLIDRQPDSFLEIVRTELFPVNQNIAVPTDLWVFKTDQEDHLVPPWYNRRWAEEMCRNAIPDWSRRFKGFDLEWLHWPSDRYRLNPHPFSSADHEQARLFCNRYRRAISDIKDAADVQYQVSADVVETLGTHVFQNIFMKNDAAMNICLTVKRGSNGVVSSNILQGFKDGASTHTTIDVVEAAKLTTEMSIFAGSPSNITKDFEEPAQILREALDAGFNSYVVDAGEMFITDGNLYVFADEKGERDE